MKRMYIIRTNEYDYCEVLSNLHKQLQGNQDYVDSNIVLNDSETRCDGTTCEIHVCIYEECKEIPELKF